MALVTVGVTLLALIPAFQLWRARADVPFTYRADALAYTAIIQNMIEGDYQQTDRLGAPFGQDLRDFPQGGDNLQLAVVKGLTLITGEPSGALNGYLLLTFPLVALTALFVLRWLGVSRGLAAVFAIAFAFLPYHFYRGTNHIYLSGYYAVPLAVYLVVSVLEGRVLFKRRDGTSRVLSLLSRRNLGTLLVCAVVGSTGTYYIAFTLVFLAAAAAWTLVQQRTLRSVVPAVLLVVAISGTQIIHLAPNLVYSRTHGANTEAMYRHPSESERYGLKVASMVLPQSGHRFSPLAPISEHYAVNTPLVSEGGQALGSLGTVGFLWLVGVALFGLAGIRTRFTLAMHRRLAYLALVGVLMGTVGGGAVLFNFVVTAQIRSWNRISVFIAFFSLAALALLIDQGRNHPARSRRATAPTTRGRRIGVGAALVALTAFVLVDQTTSLAVPRYETTAEQFDNDRAFVRSIEAQLPAEAMVFQLPVFAYPNDQPLAKMGIYDHARGYLHSQTLRWSFGGMMGREADWQQTLAGQPADLLVSRLAATGFAGIYIDRFGYHDSARALEAELVQLLGPPASVSGDERFSFFPLPHHPAGLEQASDDTIEALAEQTLHPILARPGSGFRKKVSDGDHFWLEGDASATLRIVNPAGSARAVRIETTVVAGEGGRVGIAFPDGSTETVIPATGGVALTRTFSAPPGVSLIRFTTDGPGLPNRVAPDGTRLELESPAIYDVPPTGITSGAVR
jgi:phosphoglycerol transferase